MLDFIKRFFSKKPGTDFAELVKNGALIVDVRSSGEYQSGHIKGSVNIPLDQLSKRTSELKKKNIPVITCCLSGGRSSSARSILSSAGIECYNGGGWNSLQKKIA